SNLSTNANKFYPTLAEANYYIATMALNDVVTIGEEANKGLWYKATAGATSLTKSPYDPLVQARNDADSNPLFKTRDLVAGEDVHNLRDGNYRINTAEVAATILNLPSDLIGLKVGTLIVRRGGPNLTNGNSNAYMLFIKYDDINQKYE